MDKFEILERLEKEFPNVKFSQVVRLDTDYKGREVYVYEYKLGRNYCCVFMRKDASNFDNAVNEIADVITQLTEDDF